MSKLIRISYQNLPDFNVLTEKYQVRYRIKSGDGNRVSYWSPIYSINPEFIYETSGNLVIEKHTGYTKTVWRPAIIKKNNNVLAELSEYDVWIRWGTGVGLGEWQHDGRISTSSLDLIKPSTETYLSVEIYVPGTPILRKAMYDIDQSNSAAKINLTTDVITLPENVFKTGYKILYESSSPVGGLTSGNDYYARMITSTTMTLHPTEDDAINNTNKINITSHSNSPGYFTWEDCTVCNFLLYSNYNFNPV